MDPSPPSGRWMTPSELGEYTFCPRAWWYGRQEALARVSSGADTRKDAFARGLQVQADLQEAHIAGEEHRRFPWGALAALSLAVLGGFVLWTLWW